MPPPNGTVEESLGEFDLAPDLIDLSDHYEKFGGDSDNARVVAAAERTECLTVQLPGVPFGEEIARAAEWWAGAFTGAIGSEAEAVRRLHQCATGRIQELVGVSLPDKCPDGSKPRPTRQFEAPDRGFQVQIPGWQDIIQLDNRSAFNERTARQQQVDRLIALRNSPTPPSLTEIGQILTTLDDLQDEASTLAVTMMLVQKLAGRAIPGIGWVATAADALALLTELSRVVTGSGLPSLPRRGASRDPKAVFQIRKGGSGKFSKRSVVDKGKATRGGFGGRVDELKRSGRLRVGISDVLQGLQATDSLFGFGIQIGGIFGFLQDAFWLGVRGGELKFRGPSEDPLGLTKAGRQACYRSPTLGEVHPQAYFVLANEALSLWSHASRIMPYIDQFEEPVLARTLIGLRMAEGVLGPWLRSGVWVESLAEAVQRVKVVRGGVEAHDTKDLPASEWLSRTVPGTMAAVTRAIGNVSDRGRQSFYESVSSSIGFGFLGSLEPLAELRERQPFGHLRDAFLLAEAELYPSFDRGE